jgi:hypothetical protein
MFAPPSTKNNNGAVSDCFAKDLKNQGVNVSRLSVSHFESSIVLES